MDVPPSDPAGHTFELSGGALCLDFANTWEDRGRPEQEHLLAYPDLLSFARQTGILERGEAAELGRRAREDPPAAEGAFASAVEIRDAIYRLFSSLAGGGAPPAEALDRLNWSLPEALAGLRLEPGGGGDGGQAGFVWSRRDAADTLDAPLRPIVRSAAELLTSDECGRVRECDGARCTWLFLDRSRNRSRRWCSMETCGNRAKARRHYRRRGGTSS